MLQKLVQRNENHGKSLNKEYILVNKSTKGSASPYTQTTSYLLVPDSVPPWLPFLPKSPPEGKATPAAHLRGHKGQNKKPLLQDDDFSFLPDTRVQTQLQSQRVAPGSVLTSAACAEAEFFGFSPALA